MKVTVLIIFVINFLYNLKCKSNNKISVKIQSKIVRIISVFAIVVSIICYKFDNTLPGYLVAMFAIASIYSSLFHQGISEKGINITMNSTTILKFVKFDEIKNINIEKKNDNLKIKIYAYGNIFTQIYNRDYEDAISEMLSKNPEIQTQWQWNLYCRVSNGYLSELHQ